MGLCTAAGTYLFGIARPQSVFALGLSDSLCLALGFLRCWLPCWLARLCSALQSCSRLPSQPCATAKDWATGQNPQFIWGSYHAPTYSERERHTYCVLTSPLAGMLAAVDLEIIALCIFCPETCIGFVHPSTIKWSVKLSGGEVLCLCNAANCCSWEYHFDFATS